ncbi:hypothetical protein ACFLUD_01025 [Chloroflexota bacterium]
MGKLNDIEQKLSSGSTPSQLKKEGYAKSSVTYVDRKLKKAEPASTPTSPVDDELKELRHQKEVVKLKKEIAELEDSKEKIPDRLEKLEADVLLLNKEIPDLVWKCYVSLYGVILRYQGWDDDKSQQEAISTANDFLKHFGYER